MPKELETLFSQVRFQEKAALITHFKERKAKVQAILAREVVPAHLQGMSEDEAFLRVISSSDLYNIMDIGYYHGYSSNDPVEYLNALFTSVRLKTERTKLLGSGTDHCKFYLHVIDHLACNQRVMGAQLIHTQLGKSIQGHRFAKAITNLLQALLFEEESLLESALIEAEEYLGKKNPKFESYTIQFLKALILKKEDEINGFLVDLIKGYRKNKWLHEFGDPFLKLIGNFPIGLYKLGKHYLRADPVQIQLPEHPVIWPEFVALDQKGMPSLVFDGSLAGLNVYFGQAE